MSYALDVAPDARMAWLRLDVTLQEAVLDELDQLADHPFSLPRGSSVRDIVREFADMRHYVFVQVFPNHARQTLHVYSIGSYERPIAGART